MSMNKLVCIVDDDAVYTYGIKKLIMNSDPKNTILSYSNGKQALESLKNLHDSSEELPDVILLDLNMPEMNGWEFLKGFEAIRQDAGKSIQIFVISSQVNSNQEEIFRVEWDSKVSDFIRKPVNSDTILKILGA